MLDWGKYIAVADRFQHKEKAQDREDLKHTIYIKTGADKHIRFEDNFLVGFYKMKNFTDKFYTSSDSPITLPGITSYQGDL
jgi:hypothetical protein